MNTPPLIAVDIGNSSTKIGWDFSLNASGLPAPKVVHEYATGESPPDGLLAALPAELASWHIVSVHREGTRILAAGLQTHRGHDEVRRLSHRDLPIDVQVAAPDRVGLDRLAAAVAAGALKKANRPAIVITAGSAITVNLIAADGAFEGGSILPGYRMSAEALYSADLLPLTLLSLYEEPPPTVGKDTEAAIRSGLFWGAVGAVRELVNLMTAQLRERPEVFVTGGDLRRLAEHLGSSARFVPNMVLSGIALAASRTSAK